MCLRTSTEKPLESAIINGETHIVGWKKFYLGEDTIQPLAARYAPYEITELPNKFLLFTESCKNEQDIYVTWFDTNGKFYVGTSSRKLPVGMHVRLDWDESNQLIPVLFKTSDVVLFDESSYATVSQFLISPVKYVEHNLALRPGQLRTLRKLWENYFITYEKGK